MAVKTKTPAKVDATSVEMQIKALEEGIMRAEKNVKIFSDEVQKQIILKAELEAELLKLKAKTHQPN